MTTDQVRVGRRTVQLSRTDKILFPDDGLTKGDLISYYEAVAARMIPYLKGRPLSLERFPDGINDQQVFQQTVPRYFPDWIETASVKRVGGRGSVKHAVAGSAAAQVYLANQACITPHAWLSRADRPTKPDQLIFDLDPPGDDFPAARRAATPLDWSELDDRRMRGDRFTLRTVLRRLEQDGDPWRTSSRRGRSLTRPWRRLNDLLAEESPHPRSVKS